MSPYQKWSEIRKPLKMKLIDHVRDGQKVHFSFYAGGELWYKTDSGLEFPVPISDIGNAVFLRDDKAILFMRYIRKHLEIIDRAREEQT